MAEGYTQREMILRALARGDGQMMDSFEMGPLAETKYGDQADQIEHLIASEQRRALRQVARELENTTRLLRGLPGGRARRSEIGACADRIRAFGRRLTMEAHERYAERRAVATATGCEWATCPCGLPFERSQIEPKEAHCTVCLTERELGISAHVAGSEGQP